MPKSRIDTPKQESSRSEDMYRVLFNAISDGIFLHGFKEDEMPLANFIEVNEAACKQSGYTKEELLQLSPLDLSPLAKEFDFQSLKEKFLNDKKLVFESEMVRKDGAKFPVEISSYLLTFEGQAACMTIVRDITEQKKAKTTSAKLATIVDMLPEILYFKDSAGVYQTINRAFEQFVGQSCEKVIGKTDYELLPSDLAQQCSAGDKALIASGKPLRCEEKYNDNGEERYFDTIKVPLYDEEGNSAGIIGVSREITESKKTAVALQSSREHLLLATELAHLAPWKYHPEAGLFEFSEEFYAIYGTTLEAEGAFMSPDAYAREFVHPDDAWLVEEEFKKYQAFSGRRYSEKLNHRIIRRDGEVRVITVLINIEKDDSGNVIAWYGANQDITEQKEIETALQRKTSEIQETLQMLQQTQAHLIQQEKMAGIGLLAAGVAHEINNPLSFILSNFDTLREYVQRMSESIAAYRALARGVQTDANSSLRGLVDSIDILEKNNRLDHIMKDLSTIIEDTGDGLTRVGSIVRALRFFSRVDHNDNFEKYDLNAGIRNTLLIVRNEVRYVAEIREELGDIPLIEAAGGMVNQVLLNIILNAAQALKAKYVDPSSTGVIKIRSFCDDDFAYCSVEDNGPGIPEEIHRDIFSPFFTTKPVGQGTGLGLSISYDIVVNKHGGELVLSSEEGVGSTFVIKLPIRQCKK